MDRVHGPGQSKYGPCAACLVKMRDDMLLFILFTNTCLNRLGIEMLTVGTDMAHWLYFDCICSL